eukprot:CAMPEP_0115037870 /NCGR_PEP_ID=MMETSP0216-20121206/43066_1 /TAXON_ID=223996 /ORGANISM="Protocruzia adherens, Strain Boccale" /LENGTH=147 /DNA_ID=CAMNT_0002418153 /DNA_START=111 /DNA_END=555 /DNA_ORIENTATION=-
MNQTATGNISGGVTFSDNSRPGYADDSRDHAESTLSTAQRGFSQYNTQGDDPTFGNETSEENVNIDQTALDMSHKSPLELLKAQPLIKKDLEQLGYSDLQQSLKLSQVESAFWKPLKAQYSVRGLFPNSAQLMITVKGMEIMLKLAE